MKYRSVFDIIGPIMIGPSSSHTAGAARIGRIARTIFGKKPAKAKITFYGSFAQTYKGHGTEVAIVGGILDFDTSDPRIVDSLSIAKEEGIEIEVGTSDELVDHPNTARVLLMDEKDQLELVGVSIGGGKVEVTQLNGFTLSLTGEYPALLVLHEDRYGMIAAVANLLSKYEINIGKMQVSRKGTGEEALMIIETDQNVTPEMADEIKRIPFIRRVAVIWP